MQKIERELQNLKAKAHEQDLKINQDSRILHLEAQIEFFKQEFDRLLIAKDKNQVELEKLNTDCLSMNEDNERMKLEVKAQKR